MRRVRTVIAGVAATFLAFGALVLGSTTASAAYEESRPGVQSPSLDWSLSTGTSWRPGDAGSLIAQPFIQTENGVLAGFNILVADIPMGHNFASVAIHTFEVGVGPSSEPIAGGVGQMVGSVTKDEDSLWAEIQFPDRPSLEAETHYALVIDPFGNEDPEESTSLLMALLFPMPAETNPYLFDDGQWYGQTNASHLIFTSTLVTLFAETAEPTLVASEVCDVEATITIPESEGIVYTEDREGDVVTVTAAPADGYELAPDQVISWEFSLAAEPCPTEEVPGTDEDDETPGTDEGDETPGTDEGDETETETPTTPAEETTGEKLATTGASSITAFVLMGAVLLAGGAAALAAAQRKRAALV